MATIASANRAPIEFAFPISAKTTTGGKLMYWLKDINISTSLDVNKDYILMKKKFDRQCQSLINEGHYEGLENELSNLFETSFSLYQNLNPESIVFEVTYDNSILFIIEKNGYKIFIENYLENEDLDECVATIYYEETKLPLLAGCFDEVYNEIRLLFSPVSVELVF